MHNLDIKKPAIRITQVGKIRKVTILVQEFMGVFMAFGYPSARSLPIPW
jgi:hypothetical protein